VKILMLAHRVPWPLHDGYSLHNYHYSRQLGARHEMHLMALGGGPHPPEIAGQFRSITLLPVRSHPRRSLPLRLTGALSAAEVHDFDPLVHAALVARLARTRYDIVWTAGAKMMVYTHAIASSPARRAAPDIPSLPVLGDVADDGVKEAFDRLRHSRGARELAFRARDWIRTRRFQERYFRHARVITVVAPSDRAAIERQVPGVPVVEINNGVDLQYFQPLRGPQRHPSLVFEGTMSFRPNAEACVHFVREVLPLIREKLPDTTLTIVGKDPRADVRALAGPHVEVTGFVPDVRPYLDRASLLVCPLISGAGIKNKILQAWAMEKAVVATPVSCGGLKIEPGENIVVAEGRRDFADAVVALLGDAPRRAALGAAGRRTVIANSSWEAKAREMEAVLERVALAPGA
jgi:glycosyltransferase involved in cell wall biosynthesis